MHVIDSNCSTQMSRQQLLEEDAILDVSPFVVNEDDVKAKLAAIEEEKRRNKMLLISFLLMMIFGLGNRIFNILQMIPMTNYPIFLSAMTTFAYIPLSFAYIIPMIKYGQQITQEQQDIPKRVFFYIGALDSVSGIMQTLSINFIQNGTLVVMVMQTAVPISMAVSKWFLGTKYRISQYVGCVIVAAGLAVVLIPTLMAAKKKDECSTENSASTIGLAILGLTLANIPMCLSTVVKEKTLGETSIDPIYLNGWVAIYQFLFSFPLMLPAAPTVGLSIKDLPRNLVDGAKCWFGVNSIKNTTAAITALSSFGSGLSTMIMDDSHSVPQPVSNTFFSSRAATVATMTHSTHTLTAASDTCDDTTYDDCAMAPVYVNIYIFFNLIYNILIILIIKYGSANMLWVAMTIMVPLSSIAFSLDFMPNHQDLKIKDILGLIIILAGLITYRFFTQIRQSIFGKTISDIAEEQQLEDEQEQARMIGNVNSSAAPITNSSDMYEESAAASIVARSGSSPHSDSYMPPVVDSYTEAEVAPGVENSALKKKKSKSNKKK